MHTVEYFELNVDSLERLAEKNVDLVKIWPGLLEEEAQAHGRPQEQRAADGRDVDTLARGTRSDVDVFIRTSPMKRRIVSRIIAVPDPTIIDPLSKTAYGSTAKQYNRASGTRVALTNNFLGRQNWWILF